MNSLRSIAAIAVLALGAVLCVSCRMGPSLPAADFSTPGWEVRQGQAVWKPSRKRPELAGDLLLATNANGDYMIQFTKTPFALATARVQSKAWQVEFGSGRYNFRGRGEPPRRFVWFELPSALGGIPPARPWIFTRKPDDSWRLENSRTGETLEGVIFQ